jgi:hypothetical protein
VPDLLSDEAELLSGIDGGREDLLLSLPTTTVSHISIVVIVALHQRSSRKKTSATGLLYQESSQGTVCRSAKAWLVLSFPLTTRRQKV